MLVVHQVRGAKLLVRTICDCALHGECSTWVSVCEGFVSELARVCVSVCVSECVCVCMCVCECVWSLCIPLPTCGVQKRHQFQRHEANLQNQFELDLLALVSGG
jgi:hypothetical protein